MIDEKKLVKDLLYLMPAGFGSEAMQWFRDLIDSQPKVNEWIPCSKDNLSDDEVLCQDKFGEMMIGYVFEDEVSENGFSAESEREYMYNCVAWMPKPQEYREDGANG